MTPSERKALVHELDSLPVGTLVKRTIRGAERFYHQWRENGKTRSHYLTRDEADELRRQVMRGKELKLLLAGRDNVPRAPVAMSCRTDIATGKALYELTKGVAYRNVEKYLMSL